MKYLTLEQAVKLLPKRKKSSHKGDNGRVLVVGGSKDYYGAPILAAIAALNSGADLVYLVVPECNYEVSRVFMPDLMARDYPGEYLNKSALKIILALAEKCDCVVLGPGLGQKSTVKKTVKNIIKKVNKPLVLDADGLKGFVPVRDREIMITPHKREFEILAGKMITPKNKESLVLSFAKKNKTTVLLKGAKDLVCSEWGEIAYNKTGNAGMTVGGTGDVLAGVLGSLRAQGLSGFNACKLAAFVNGLAGDQLEEEKGYCYTASDLVAMLPYVIKKLHDEV